MRLTESRIQQANLAKEYGIYGFCYYHYWFNGRRLLHQPLDDLIATGEPDFPFCLCWANENWSRTWDGAEHEILMQQSHNLEDDEKHMRFLCDVFRDKRYITVDGKPVFIVYRTNLFPDIARTAELWRKIAVQEGFPGLYLCAVERGQDRISPESFGFDAAMEFQPDSAVFPKREWGDFFEKVRFRFKKDPLPYGRDFIYDYGQLVQNVMNKSQVAYKRYPCVTPGWDNSARKAKNAVIFRNSTPELYKQWLQHAVKNFVPFSKEENFLFINAWNEWAEGNHLEPDQKWDRAFLEATKDVLAEINSAK